jgi:ribonuclease D
MMRGFENPNYNYIKNKGELISYLKDLEDKKCLVIALDTEAEMNRHAYGEKLCLIQIFDGTNKVLIDPFEIDNISLKTLFESRNILKIMYDASSDSSLLKNTYNIDIKSVLDLRPAIELLNFDKQDLHSVIAIELGITLTRKLKFQRYNWMKRPIDKEAIDYAINDVIYLFRLKDALFKKLYTKNILDVFILKNLQVQNKDYWINPKDRYKKIKGYHGLSEDEKRIFKRVFDVRDKYAKMCNMPSYYVINKIDLIDIAKGVKHVNELKFPKRFSESLIQNILNELKSAVESLKTN